MNDPSERDSQEDYDNEYGDEDVVTDTQSCQAVATNQMTLNMASRMRRRAECVGRMHSFDSLQHGRLSVSPFPTKYELHLKDSAGVRT